MNDAVLILGGTSEARALASALVGRGVPVVSSLAGRVANPRLPVGEVRVGGFGGRDGLAQWLHEHQVRAVVDATHPFAERISAAAAAVCPAAGVPLLRLERPGWSQPDGAEWHWADTLAHAADMLPDLGKRTFLTTGRQGLAAVAGLTGHWFLIRCVDPPAPPLPPQHEVLLARGPYTVDGELELMREHRVDALVTKDSGGSMTVAKLHAAQTLGLPVVIVRRPPRPDVPTLHSVDAAADWVLTHGGPH